MLSAGRLAAIYICIGIYEPNFIGIVSRKDPDLISHLFQAVQSRSSLIITSPADGFTFLPFVVEQCKLLVSAKPVHARFGVFSPSHYNRLTTATVPTRKAAIKTAQCGVFCRHSFTYSRSSDPIRPTLLLSGRSFRDGDLPPKRDFIVLTAFHNLTCTL